MVNAFSFCLYGPENPRYYPGMLENIALVQAYFPSWVVYVYVAPDVDPAMVGRLKECSNVRLRETGVTGAINMIHRFYAIDEADVEIMMVRDADSRIHWKDRWAIREFVNQPQFVAHTIRDNIEHTASMMGGLWALRKSSGINMHHEYATYSEDAAHGHRNGHDQNFLADVVYPKVVDRMIVHYSNNRRRLGETAVEFPFTWINDVYCGRIECDFYDTPQPPPKSIFMEPPVFSARRLPDTYVPPIVKFLARK
jgi:hypothetical protein